jgi:hypothetical protein
VELSHKILSVLVNNLHVYVKPMYQLYSILKERDKPLTLDKIDIASAKRQLDEKTKVEYLQKLTKMSENIKKVFRDQQARAIISEIPSGFPLLATYNFTTGAMGPREVQEITYGMGHRM